MAVLFTAVHAVDEMNVHHEVDEVDRIDHTADNINPEQVIYVHDDSNEDVSDYDSDNIYSVEKGNHGEEVIADSSIHHPGDPENVDADPSQPVLHVKALINGLIDDIHRRAIHPTTPEVPDMNHHRNQRKRAWGGRDLERRHSRGYALDT